MQTIAVSSDLKGFELAREKLYKEVDRKTVLFLSGGKTPAPLYKKLAKEKVIKPGAVAIVDERFGQPHHENSNEKFIKDTGLLDYLRSINVPFYSPLKDGKSRATLAKEYDELVRYLLSWFHKGISILGLGNDGHTAGLPAGVQNSKFKIQSFKEKFVEEFDDFPGEQRERISLTFNALSQMDLNLVLVFGNDKKKGLKILFAEGSIEDAPGRFLKSLNNTILITDQKV
jgi:6-phosphogluconolactonase/glucosamine-6-phosphate isomerase/deaminase